MYQREKNFEPNFNNLLKVLNNQIPDRPVLFEYFMNDRIIRKLSGENSVDPDDSFAIFKRFIKAFSNGGYDYTTISAWRTNTLAFPKGEIAEKESHSLNAGSIITDRASFDNYDWPNPEIGNYDLYQKLKDFLPGGMKLITSSNGGILENVIDLVGFENLSLMYMMDEALTTEIFDAVGARIFKFYKIVAAIETVGACIVNDDWGFKNQSMFPPEFYRRWIFPWYKKIVSTIHENNKPAILHSCGQVSALMPDVIHDLKFDAKHSFEDQITPVEKALDFWGNEIAILGGIDMDYLARKTPDKIRRRAEKLLHLQSEKGGYALGSGNSIPDYIPDDNYFAMIETVKNFK